MLLPPGAASQNPCGWLGTRRWKRKDHVSDDWEAVNEHDGKHRRACPHRRFRRPRISQTQRVCPEPAPRTAPPASRLAARQIRCQISLLYDRILWPRRKLFVIL